MESRSFARFLRAKQRAYAWLLVACALAALLLPLAMHGIDLRFDATGGWHAVEAFKRLHAHVGAPWWLLAWLFPIAFALAVALVLLAFESLVFALRLDRGDHAWSSMCWTLRGWVAVLPWALAAGLLVLATLALANWLAAWPKASWSAPTALLDLALGFFVWNAAYLAAPKPGWRPRPRWPGLLPLVLSLLMMLLAFAIVEWFLEPPSLLMWTAPLIAFALATITVQLAWLNRARTSADAAAALRDALRPGVFLPMLVLHLRWTALLPLLLLPLLPIWLLFAEVVPLLEPQLSGSCCAMERWGPMIKASRFVVAWWWAIALSLFGLLGYLPQSWFSTVSSGRMLLELGLVRDERPRAEG